MSFLEDKIGFEGLTFDDVLLIPSFSELLPRNIDLLHEVSITRGVPNYSSRQ